MTEDIADNYVPILFDRISILKRILKYIAIGIPLFLGYAIVLLLICDENPVLLLIHLFLQVTVGFFGIRYTYTLGRDTRATIHILDTTEIKSSEFQDYAITSDSISKVFERYLSNLENKLETDYDDWMDIAWFAVLVLAMIQTLLLVIDELPFICFLPSPFLGVLCIGIFVNGYRTVDITYIIEELEYLEYLLKNKIERIITLSSGLEFQVYAIVETNYNLLHDLKIEISPDRESLKVTYYVGLPKEHLERIQIQTSSLELVDYLQNIDLSNTPSWKINTATSTEEMSVIFTNNVNSIDITQSSTYVKSPSSLTDDLQELGEIVKSILELIR
ncbi:MAG: hypothetical protein GF411_12165 [Candidatus Lokiarchaeota archaeon]|nr:hypothetical protein [Candidatus Lokiarchaeota archaeon]